MEQVRKLFTMGQWLQFGNYYYYFYGNYYMNTTSNSVRCNKASPWGDAPPPVASRSSPGCSACEPWAVRGAACTSPCRTRLASELLASSGGSFPPLQSGMQNSVKSGQTKQCDASHFNSWRTLSTKSCQQSTHHTKLSPPLRIAGHHFIHNFCNQLF